MFAAVVHYYYKESWELLREPLLKASKLLDIFFTIPEDKVQEIEIDIKTLFPEARIIQVLNGGMDIGPFLRILPELHELGYSHVCKLHTKNIDDDVSRIWFSWLIDSLIGHVQTIIKVKTLLQDDPAVVSVGVAGLFLSARRSMYGNLHLVEEIYRRTFSSALPSNDWGFFAGTMFWSRIDYLLPVTRQALNSPDLFEENCGSDGHIVHALERLMGCVCDNDREKVALLHFKQLGSLEQDVVPSRGHSGISRWVSGEAVCRYFHLRGDVFDLRSSGEFRDYLYYGQHPEISNTDADPAIHFCLIGGSQSTQPPCGTFLSSEFLNPDWLARLRRLISSWGLARNEFSFLVKYGKNLPKLQEVLSHQGFIEFLSEFRSLECFDKHWYKAQLSPGFKAPISLDVHYLIYGFKVGLQPIKGFDPLEFLLENPDVLQSGVEPLIKYISDLRGRKE